MKKYLLILLLANCVASSGPEALIDGYKTYRKNKDAANRCEALRGLAFLAATDLSDPNKKSNQQTAAALYDCQRANDLGPDAGKSNDHYYTSE